MTEKRNALYLELNKLYIKETNIVMAYRRGELEQEAYAKAWYEVTQEIKAVEAQYIKA